MTGSTDEILAGEQQHFDLAFDAREASRQRLTGAANAAGGPSKVAAIVGKAGKEAAAKLGDPESPVAFGKIDRGGEEYYIGTHSILDGEQDPLVINWQAPLAAAYYEASVADPMGVSVRRAFRTDGNEVLDFEDIVFAELAERVGNLTGQEQWGVNDTLLRDLDKGRTGEMDDIVQTIHAAQYALIRRPMSGLLVIQGGPGTGKTAVALHRVSWLLYNEPGLDASDVLVIGPNPTFTRYIRKVLPSLGDANVQHSSLRELGPVRSNGRVESAELAELKGDARMAKVLVTALRQRVRLAERAPSLQIGGNTGPVFDRSEIDEMVERFLDRSTYNVGRTAFRNHLAAQARERAKRAEISAQAIEQAVDRVWPPLTPQSFLREFFASRDRLLAAAGDDFTASEVTLLSRAPSTRLSEEKWSDADVALLDEAEYLIQGSARAYRHVVVDEAQDLSPMQMRSVSRRAPSGSLTVVGDLAQGTGAWARESWDEVVAQLATDAGSEVVELDLGYRVPRQIYEFAAQLLPYAAPRLTPPTVVREGPADPDLIEHDPWYLSQTGVEHAQEHAGKGRFVGIVCPEELREEVEDELRNNDVAFGDVSRGDLTSSINVMTPQESKGLEFDAVVVIHPELIAQAPHGHRLLYIAMTRTTRHLSVVHSGSPLGLPSISTDSVAVTTIDATAPPQEPASPSDELLGQALPEPVTLEGQSTPVPGLMHVQTEVLAEDDFAQQMARQAARKVTTDLRRILAPDLWPVVVSMIAEEMSAATARTDD
ncbi:UvrD-helicase domain-containing protein [Janibacter sp. DB-40]|uniref:HelD family protein n=1 Tax=Janibacter sp. DB-40 TaxID=3028808 RepID=UPI0024073D27|nr:UvrD-helicase domain-containing protein [Janibacter sp. DB-40]